MPNANTIELSCNCGKLRGKGLNITPKTGKHIICMCSDCQAFTRFLDRDAELLDQNGGTELFQITPSQIRLETGLEHLACMRLSPKGTLRWYANCCNTPIANTVPTPGLPFAGVFCDFIETDTPETRHKALGPIIARFFARDGYGQIPDGAQHKINLGAILQAIPTMIRLKLTGHAKPTPFFKADKTPVVTPSVLSNEERKRYTTA